MFRKENGSSGDQVRLQRTYQDEGNAYQQHDAAVRTRTKLWPNKGKAHIPCQSS